MEVLSMPTNVQKPNTQVQPEQPASQPPADTSININQGNLSSVSGESSSELTEYDKAVLKAFAETDAEETVVENKERKDPEIDVEEHVQRDALLKAATALDPAATNSSTKITVSEEDRRRFLDCIVTGERYTETFDLFGGRVHGKIRCRSLDETEAIEAHIRRQVITRKIVSQAEYTALVRRSLLAAQIEELNGVKFPELEKPLFAVETSEELKQPGWLGRLDSWGSKPDAIVVTIVGRIIDFEARYWAMIRSSENENFWKTGEFIEE